MRFQIIAFTLGFVLMIIGTAGLVPAFIDLSVGHANAHSFFLNAFASLFFGMALVLANKSLSRKINIRQMFMMTVMGWLFLATFGALPFYTSDLNISFASAFFESMSGITTTGSTTIVGLEHQSPGILMWRSILSWIGGIGIVAFAMILLPFLQIGGMQLFQTESSDKSEKIMPRSRDMIRSLMVVYIALTALCTLTFYILGMSFFDALNHAMGVIPTCGFSTYDASFSYFENPAIHYAGALFMFAGGLPFILYIKLLYQGNYNFWQDDQFRTFCYMLAGIIFVMTAWLWFHSEYSLEYSFRHVTFNVVSIITTTGYMSTDYLLWGPFAIITFFFITYLGACAGSTAGGIKVMRVDIIIKALIVQINSLLYPNARFVIRYQGRPVEQHTVINILGFLGLYVLTNVVVTVALTATGLDFETAISGAATAIANTGPGIGPIIGPAGNFSSLSDTAKWILSFGMIMGRLEIMTILVLFTKEYWQN